MKLQKKYILIFIVLFILVFSIIYFISKPKVEKRKEIVSSGKFTTGDNLNNMLLDEGINATEISNIAKALLSQKYNLKKTRVGEKYILVKSTSNELIKLTLIPSYTEKYHVKKTVCNTYYCEKEIIQLETKIVKSSGSIVTSLYETMINNGLPPELIMEFADIFSWRIDFLTEVRYKDEYKLIYEKMTHNGKTISFGKILAAEYNGKATSRHTAVYFNHNKYKGYYTPDGKSTNAFFLRAPLSYRRISSYFSYKRFHPILRKVRPHLGIDYAAPAGTPVSTVGDGRVIFCGWRGGLGKTIIIKHPNNYTTMYGHLSKFAKGIKVGKKVKQGDRIGYVGSTGLSTGPHLDFRVIHNGRFVNFLKLKFPPHRELKGETLKEFKAHTEKLLSDLSSF